MKKIFSFLCLIVAVTAMTSCSSAKEEKGTSGTGNAVLDNIFERKSVRAYLNKGVEKEKIDLMLRAGMAAPTGRDIRPWEFVVVSDRAKLDSMAAHPSRRMWWVKYPKPAKNTVCNLPSIIHCGTATNPYTKGKILANTLTICRIN